jgi:outer membrane protein assembly factor BamA
LDLNELNRTLSLRVGARFVEPVNDSEIPFTELATLGGTEPMRGFFPNRLTDFSAVAADLAYTWPIWIWLDGSMHFEVGNVFGEHLAGFEAKKLRWSGSIGFESAGVATENPLQVMVGVGSETFEQGGGIDSFRLVLGTTRDF